MTDSMKAAMDAVEMMPTLPLPTAPDGDSAEATTEDVGSHTDEGDWPPTRPPVTTTRPEGEDDTSDPSPASHRRRRLHAAFIDRFGPM